MRAAAEKALQLDPLLAEAYGTLGLIRAADREWQQADQAFRRALQLNPSLAGVHRDFAWFLLAPENILDEALQHARKAIELDPLSSSPQLLLASLLLRTGKYADALDVSRRLLTAKPGDVFAGQLQARALLLEGKPRDALAILETQGPPSHGYLGYTYATIGRRHDAERLAIEEDPAAARHQVLIYAALGDRDRVFDALQKVAAMDDPMADLYPGEPELAFLRDDARMKNFRRIRNLP
jgi:tetratricopeptide (TPR) repeat protein